MKRIVALYLIFIGLIFIAGCGGEVKAKLGFVKPGFAKAPPEIMYKIVNAGDAFSNPDANTIIIETIDSTIFNEDGTQVQYSYSLSKPLTPQGMQDEKTADFGYDSQMMLVEILYAMVIHPDSTIEFVPDSEIIDQVASDGMAEMDIYWTNLRKKIVNFPQLYSGDAIAIAYKYTMLKPYFEGVISGIGGFQSSEPIHYNRSTNFVPASMASGIRHKIKNDTESWVRFSEYESGDYHVFVWEADSTPALVSEVGMPPASKFVPLVMFSNVTWKQLSQKAFDITEPPMLIKDPEIEKTITAIVETCKTEIDSISAIGLWVAQEIRYVGLSLGDKEGITPHDINETFDAKAGVCKDKSALAVAMLRQAGFEAYNVLTNPVGHVVYDIAANQFNHQIVMAKTRSGKEIYIDVTDDICRDLLPGYYSKRAYLILSEKGVDLKYFDIVPADKNMGKIDARTTIDEAGNLNSVVEISGAGLYDEVIRQIGQYLEKEDQKRFFRQLITQIDPGAKLISAKIEPEPVKILAKPAKITIEYEAPDFAITAENYLLITVPSALHIYDILSASIAENLKLEDRKYPLWFMYTFGAEMNEVIELPVEYEPKSIPGDVEVNNPYLKYSMNYEIDGRIIRYHSVLKLNDVDIPLRNYAEFRDAHTEYKNSEKGMLFLNKESD